MTSPHLCTLGLALLLTLAPAAGAAEAESSERGPGAQDSLEEGAERTLEVGPPAGFAWAGHGVVAALPLVELALVSRGDGGRPWRAVGTFAAGALLGALPMHLAYAYSNPTEARWREVDVVLLGLSLVLTPPLTALGTWGSAELLLGGSVDAGRAWLGALAGAATGHLLGLILNGLLVRLFPDPEPDLGGFRVGIALGLVGASATLGQQWLGGGPRPR